MFGSLNSGKGKRQHLTEFSWQISPLPSTQEAFPSLPTSLILLAALFVCFQDQSHPCFDLCNPNLQHGNDQLFKQRWKKETFFNMLVKLLSSTYIVQPQVIGEEYFGVSWVWWASVPHQEKRSGKSLAFKELDCVVSAKCSNKACCVRL